MHRHDDPFMLVACESSVYSARYFGFGDQPPIVDQSLAGTTCLIGGASVTDDGLIRPAGLMQAWLGEATWLVPEAVTAWLAESLHRVTFVREPVSGEPFVEVAQQAGMKVMANPGCIVCQGLGEAMRLIHWLNLSPSNRSALLAFRAEGLAFERAMIQQARKSVDVYGMLNVFRGSGQLRRGDNIDYRKFCCLAVWLGGREDSDVIINTTLADADAIKQRCYERAIELGVALYDAGSISALEDSGYFNLKRMPQLPALWTRIA